MTASLVTTQLIDTISHLDKQIRAGAPTCAAFRARAAADAIRPGVRGVVVDAPADAMRAFGSDVDYEDSASWGALTDKLNGEDSHEARCRVSVTGLVIMRDGSVDDAPDVAAAVAEAYRGLEGDMPLGGVSSAVPGLNLTVTLELIGWLALVGQSWDELAHDGHARINEESDQTFQRAREIIAVGLNAYNDLTVEQLNFGIDNHTLETELAAAPTALGKLNSKSAAEQVCYDFPGAVTVSIAILWDEFQAAEVIEASASDGTILYKLGADSAGHEGAFFDDIEPTDLAGEPFDITPGTVYSTQFGVDFTSGTVIDIVIVIDIDIDIDKALRP